MGSKDLEWARKVVSQAELEALDQAEELRREAQELLEAARAEAARVVEDGTREAEEAALSLRRELVRQLIVLRDALVRADDSFHAFLESVGADHRLGPTPR